jgi:hypothetical protein
MPNLDIALTYYLRMYINELHDVINSGECTDTNKQHLRDAIDLFDRTLDRIENIQENILI